MKNLVPLSFLSIYSFIILLLSCSAKPASLSDNLGLISSIYTFIEFTWKPESIFPSDPADDSFFKFMYDMDQIQVSQKLMNIEKGIERIYEDVPLRTNYIGTLQNHGIQINKIDKRYKLMLEITQKLANGTFYNAKDKKLKDTDIEEYLRTGDGTSFDIVSEIHSTFIGENSSTLQYMEKTMKKHKVSSCSEEGELQSDQERFLNFITSIMIAQVKVYLTASMAARYFEKTGDPYPKDALEKVVTGVNQQYIDTVKLLMKLMPHASRDVWVCDPEQHVEDTTFIRLINVFQKQIVTSINTGGFCLRYTNRHDGRCREVDLRGTNITELNPDVTIEVYRKYPEFANRSAYFDLIKREKVVSENNILLNSNVCQGYLWDCEPLNQFFGESEKDRSYLICHSLENSTRRFDRIESHIFHQGTFQDDVAFGRALGQQKLCDFSQHKRSIISNAGVCTCDETTKSNSDLVNSHYTYRYFFTVKVFAAHNHIVTGARIGQHKGVIYPIIQQGKLLKGGVVDNNTLRWIDYATYTQFHEEELRKPANLVKIEWTDRTMKLGDVDLSPGQLLKGLYFTRGNVKNNIVGPLRLALVWSKFNFTTGVIDPTLHDKDDYGEDGKDRFHYINSDMIPLDNLPIPKLDEKHDIIETNGYLNFTTSEFQTDLGQTTIPYFDSQRVMPQIPTPITGAGLYYKYRPGEAGFIGIKLKTHDKLAYIQKPQVMIS